ncbi:MAG TPA: hypothetical protein VF184_11295, partial [Phycisphaeraceae bacterium]
TLVQVNVGRSDGVQENMKFMVHRGDQFVGNLVIEAVDADASAGRIVLAKDQIQPGDAILAGSF